MTMESLEWFDLSRHEEPEPTTQLRPLLEEWLGYQRHEFLRKVRDLTPEGLVAWSVPPVELSVLGLIRHMTQMENVYLSWGLAGGERVLVYGEDDYSGGSVATIDEDLRRHFDEVSQSDSAIAGMSSLDAVGVGHGRPVGATLVKMIDEYALHAGQAHMLRFAAIGKIIAESAGHGSSLQS